MAEKAPGSAHKNSEARHKKAKEQGSVNLAPSLFCYFLLCRGALLQRCAALLHVGIRSTTSLGSRPEPFFPRLGLLSLFSATYDPPLWRVRLLDARPSVTRLHARMRKKIRQLRGAIRACNQCCAAPGAYIITRFASAQRLGLKTAHSAEARRDCNPPRLTLPARSTGLRRPENMPCASSAGPPKIGPTCAFPASSRPCFGIRQVQPERLRARGGRADEQARANRHSRAGFP
jgi:hypothetical protein